MCYTFRCPYCGEEVKFEVNYTEETNAKVKIVKIYCELCQNDFEQVIS